MGLFLGPDLIIMNDLFDKDCLNEKTRVLFRHIFFPPSLFFSSQAVDHFLDPFGSVGYSCPGPQVPL